MGATDKRRDGTPPSGEPIPSITAREHAAAAAVPLLRRQAGDFASSHGAVPELVEKIELAVSEAVTNAVKYAYGPSEEAGQVELTATASAQMIEIRVVDRGGGFQPGESDGLGIGLTLIAQMSGDLEIAQSERGTAVTMRFPLTPDAESL